MVNDLFDRFVTLMDSGVLIWAAPLAAVGLWLVYVLLVTVHELAHAVASLVLTSGRVFLRVGRAPGLIHGRLGRLWFSWHVRRRGLDDGELVLEVPIIEHRDRLLFALAGPSANVLAAVLLVPTWAALSGIAQICVAATIGLSLYMAVRNLVARSPESDGRQALSALRRLNAPPDRRPSRS